MRTSPDLPLLGIALKRVQRWSSGALAALALLLAGAVSARAQSCPTSSILLNLDAPQSLTGANGAGRACEAEGQFCSDYWFTGFGDSLSLASGGFGGYTQYLVLGRYRFLGPPTGTPILAEVRVHVSGSLQGYGGDPCESTWARYILQLNGSPRGGQTWFSQRLLPESDNCGRVMSATLSATLTPPVGTVFELGHSVETSLASGFSEQARMSGRLEFGPLPPGVFVVRCDNDTTAGVVSVSPRGAQSLRIDRVWPSPATGAFRVALSARLAAPAILRLFDVSGRVLESRVWDAPAGGQREFAFEGGYAPGRYFLQVSQGAASDVRAVIVRN